METILVPTDFSENAKAGVKLAMQLSAQTRASLQFVYVHGAEPSVSKVEALPHAEGVEGAYREKLDTWVRQVYQEESLEMGPYSLVFKKGFRADVSLLDYMAHHGGIDYIAISTRGAGNRLDKFFGTNTGNLITKSPVPVIAVPSNYTYKPLEKLLYATDFRDHEQELGRVIKFAGPLNVKIELLHLLSSYSYDIIPQKDELEAKLKEKYNYDLTIHFEKKDMLVSLLKNLKREIAAANPSMLVLFTNQHRTFFQKIFLSSLAEELSFQTTVPVLVFNKQH